MNAYVSLLASDNYLKCAYGLYYSYSQIQSKYPLVILATDNLSHNTFLLLEQFKIPFIKVPYEEFVHGKRFKCTINKFYAWNLTQFKKVLFLDLDTIFISNIDMYFDNMKIHSNYGSMFLLQPAANIYNDLMSSEYKNNYCTDEEVMKEYFNINESGADFPQNQIIHLMWAPKYPEYYQTYTAIKDMINTLQKEKNTSSLFNFIKWQQGQIK